MKTKREKIEDIKFLLSDEVVAGEFIKTMTDQATFRVPARHVVKRLW